MGFDPTRKLTEKQVKEHVHDIIGHGGMLNISGHAKKRMRERGYSLRDIHHIIMDGSLVDAAPNKQAGRQHQIHFQRSGPGKGIPGRSL